MTAPLGHLLDANVLSEMMRPAPDGRVAACLDSLADEGLGLLSVTAWEILNGIGLLPPGRRRDALQRQFHALLADLFDDRILDWTLRDAAATARIMEEKRRRGEALEDHLPDAMLAGAAASRGLTILTRNEAEFRNTGVRIINPWTSPVS